MSDEDAGDEDPAQRGRGQHRGPPVQVDHRHRGHGAAGQRQHQGELLCPAHAHRTLRTQSRTDPILPSNWQLALVTLMQSAEAPCSLLATAKVVKLVYDRALVGGSGSD